MREHFEWIETNAVVCDPIGLHIRCANSFVRLAKSSECEVRVSNGKSEVDGKSVWQLCGLGIRCGAIVRIRANGINAADLVGQLQALLEQKLKGQGSFE